MWWRSERGKRSDATRKFSPRARAATAATSTAEACRPRSPHVKDPVDLRRAPARPLQFSLQLPEPEPPSPVQSLRGVSLTPSDGTTANETQGAREDPVSGVSRRDGATVVSLAGELDLYNAH